MFREKYKNIISQFHPSNELIEKVLKSNIKNEKKIIFPFYRVILVFMSICICISLAMPVLAANVETIYQLMYEVSPSIAQFFMPVQKADEDNGIKLEVVSAYIHDNVAEIYISVQDLTGNRVDDTIDLLDSYSLNRPFNGYSTCKRVGYDERTKTATFLILITEWENKKIDGDKITFSVKEFISNKKSYEDIEIPIELSSIVTAKKTQEVFSNGGSGDNYQVIISNDGYTTALIPSTALDSFPVDGIDLTAIGFIDGKLHIQTATYDNLDKDNHGYFYLKDAAGNIIKLDYDFNFINQYKQPGRIDYYECVFDVPKKEIGNYHLYGNFVTSGMHIKGNWQITFPLEK